MQCSICEKIFAATLSVCPSCGSMTTQHSQAESSLRLLSIEKINTSDLELEIDAAPPMEIVSPREYVLQTQQSSTLLSFPSAKPKTPEWREELKNKIQAKKNGQDAAPSAAALTASNSAAAKKEKLVNAAQNAVASALVINLKPNLSEKSSDKAKNVVAEALKRIERSRQKFENVETETELSKVGAAVKTGERKSEAANSPLALVPPRKVLPMIADDAVEFIEDSPHREFTKDSKPENKFERKSVFTVPLNVPTAPKPQPKFETVREKEEYAALGDLDDEETIAASLNSVRKTATAQQPSLESQNVAARAAQSQRSPHDDYAPLGKRAAAGAIDVALCAALAAGTLHFALGFQLVEIFGSHIIVFLGVTAVTLFMYTTAAAILIGATIGLLASNLEIVAAADGEVPTFPQTILRNAIYILSLITGIGLLTVFFNTEKRALHDLLSGTMVIR